MHQQPDRRSSLFLMELIIAILFFSLAAAVCVRFFVKSHTLEAQSMDLNHAVSSAASVAEIVRSQDEPLTVLTELFPGGEASETTYSIFYDKDWILCSADHAAYTVRLETKTSASFLVGDIEVLKETESLYHLTVKKYLEKEAFPS